MIMNMPRYIKGPVVELDDDHFVEWVTHKIDDFPGETGGILWHRSDKYEEGWCCGAFFFRQPPYQRFEPAPTWTINSREPLDISPSFLCHCGHHGFIKNGKWVPA